MMETTEVVALLPCPFCGGPVALESVGERYSREHGNREFWGVVCRNTINIGGSCCMEQVPSASREAAIGRWNMRGGEAALRVVGAEQPQKAKTFKALVLAP